MEEWKDIVGFDGKYMVSNFGRVKSKIIMKPRVTKNGYLQIQLYLNGKHHPRYIHRLVAENFIGDISDREINHKDGNKKNNNINNLELVSHKENCIHRSKVLGIITSPKVKVMRVSDGKNMILCRKRPETTRYRFSVFSIR